MYRNSKDAFTQLLSSRHTSQIPRVECVIISISARTGHMRNGIKYCSVQVTCSDSTEYLIQASEEEAEQLYRQAEKQSQGLKMAAAYTP